MKPTPTGKFQGWIWRQGDEDERLPGTVSLDGDIVRMETLGLFRWQAADGASESVNLRGDFMGLGPVTFWRCHYSPGRAYQADESADEMVMSSYLITYAIIGAHIDLPSDGTEPVWTSLAVGISHLREWVGTTGIDAKSKLGLISITYRQPADMTWTIEDTEFTIGFGHTFAPQHYEPELVETTSLFLTSPIGRSVTDWMTHVVSPYLDFQTLGMGVPCEVTSVAVMHPRRYGDQVRDRPCQVAMAPWRQGMALPPIWQFTHRHFDFDPGDQGFPCQFEKWLHAYDDIEDVIRLYMLSRYKASSLPFVEAGFLYAAQACESFHTAVYPSSAMTRGQADRIRRKVRDFFEGEHKARVNERLLGLERLTLMERLAELFHDHRELLAPKFDNLDDLAEQAKATRNYYSHFAKTLAARKMSVEQTLDAASALWCVVCAALMEHIGISREQAHAAIMQTREYQEIRNRRLL